MFLRLIGVVISLTFSLAGINSVYAFDTIEGGGGTLVDVLNVDNDNKIFLEDLVLSKSTPVSGEPVVITFDDDGGFEKAGEGVIFFDPGSDASTVLDTLSNFSDGDIITITDNVPDSAEFTVDLTSTIGDLASFFNGIDQLSAVFDDTDDRLDFVSLKDFQITSDGVLSDITLDFIPQASLFFSPDAPNLIVSSGDFSINDLTITDTQISFLLSGSGTLKIEDIGVFGTNFEEKGEFLETRNLDISLQTSNFVAENFIVDTTDYSAKGNFLGSSAGEDSEIFKIGDDLKFTFAPFDFLGRGTFSVDLTSIAGPSDFAPDDDTFTIVADDDDGTQSLPIIMEYGSADVTRTINSKLINIDNQPPGFDFTDFTFIELPEGKVFAGIDDIITLNMPAETTGDTVFFTADFQDIAGTSFNFVDEPMEIKSIPLQEVSLDDNGYNKNIIFTDDAGNTSSSFSTNPVGIDLIKPVVSDGSIISVVGSPSPAVIDNSIQVASPVDEAVTTGEITTYSIDLTALGGVQANFEKVEGVQTFDITAGNLNDELFSQDFTVFDKAGNSRLVTSNVLQVDNKLPTFQSTCGARFIINDKGDENEIADLTNGESDTVTFIFPNKVAPGCDFERFSMEFDLITGNSAYRFTNQDATGAPIEIPIGPGMADGDDFSLPMDIFDINGNKTSFATGTFNIDNKIITQDKLEDDSIAYESSTPDGEIHPKDKIKAKVKLFEGDIAEVKARLPEASDFASLSKVPGSTTWVGEVTVTSGLLTREFESFEFLITDDAGNVVTLQGSKDFFITNDTRVRGGGGGGSISLPVLKKKSSFQSFTPHQSKEFHNETWKARKKSKAELRLDSLKKRLRRPATSVSRIQSDNPQGLAYRRQMWRSRQAAIARDAQPKKIQRGLEKAIFYGFPEEKIKELADDSRGEFRLQSTLNNLKGTFRSYNAEVPSRRHTGINKSGKYVRIKRY